MKKIVLGTVGVLYLIIGLLFFSCVSKVSEKRIDIYEVKIDLGTITEPSIYDFFDTVSVIQLETTDDCLVSDMIYGIKEFNGKYFVLDWKQCALFCFDSEGKYLFKIHSRGQGPNEYIWLDDFNIDPFNNQLILLDPFRSILLYDLDGKFISKTKLPSEISAYNEIFVLNKDTLLFSSLAEYQILYYSRKEKKIVKKMYEKDEALHKTTFISSYGRIYSYKDSVFLPIPWNNDVINLSDNKNSISYKWNLGKETFSEKDINRLRKYVSHSDKKDYFREDIVGSNKPLKYYISNIHETERYITAVICYKNDYMSIFYDKAIEKSFLFKKTKENTQFVMAVTSFCGEKMIMSPVRESIDCLPYYNENTLNVKDIKKLQERTDDDNPYLIIYKFKSLSK
jgi:hypothetical protein